MNKGWRFFRLLFYCSLIPLLYECGVVAYWLFIAITGTPLRVVHNMAWQSDLGYFIWLFVLIALATGVYKIFQGKSP